MEQAKYVHPLWFPERKKGDRDKKIKVILGVDPRCVWSKCHFFSVKAGLWVSLSQPVLRLRKHHHVCNPRLDTYVQVYMYLCTILMYNVLYIMYVIILSVMK